MGRLSRKSPTTRFSTETNSKSGWLSSSIGSKGLNLRTERNRRWSPELLSGARLFQRKFYLHEERRLSMDILEKNIIHCARRSGDDDYNEDILLYSKTRYDWPIKENTSEDYLRPASRWTAIPWKPRKHSWITFRTPPKSCKGGL